MEPNFDLVEIAPEKVQVNQFDLREVYGERFCVANVILGWPNTNAVRAQVAIWGNVVAATLLDQVRKLNSDEICEVGITGLDFLNINSTRRRWQPILAALKKAGYVPTRRQARHKTGQKKMTRKRFESLQLRPELVPRPLWGRSLCNTLGRHSSQWYAIRKHVLEATGGACQICGARQEKGMICHEQWDYDDTHHVATLSGFQLVCSDCNLVLHGGWSSTLVVETAMRDPVKALEFWIRRETHIERVNGITGQEKQLAYNYAGKQHSERSQHRWRIKIAPEIRQSFAFLKGVKL